MILKKFYGKSIEEAREKAQQSLGKTYIVVETKERNGEEPAWIHVLDEERAEDSTKATSGTYSRRDLFPKALSKLKETVNESFQLFNLDGLTSDNSNGAAQKSPRSPAPRDERFLPYRTISNSADPQPSKPEQKVPNLHRDFDTLADRFERFENLISEQLLAVNVDFVSHPAFQQLLNNGVPYATVLSWFSELAAEGVDPYHRDGHFTRRLAQKVRETLDVVATEPPVKFMIFTGAAGAGKSSVIMKLALSSEFLGNASCALVSIVPRGAKNYYPSLDNFASEHDFIHFRIEGQRQWHELQDQLGTFDHVLIEMPANEYYAATQSEFSSTMFIQAIRQSGAVEVHHVMNAALNPQVLKSLSRKATTCDYLDFTHLDTVPKRGQLLSLMDHSGCCVRYICLGLQVPADIQKFEPAQFARQLLSNA